MLRQAQHERIPSPILLNFSARPELVEGRFARSSDRLLEARRSDRDRAGDLDGIGGIVLEVAFDGGRARSAVGPRALAAAAVSGAVARHRSVDGGMSFMPFMVGSIGAHSLCRYGYPLPLQRRPRQGPPAGWTSRWSEAAAAVAGRAHSAGGRGAAECA